MVPGSNERYPVSLEWNLFGDVAGEIPKGQIMKSFLRMLKKRCLSMRFSPPSAYKLGYRRWNSHPVLYKDSMSFRVQKSNVRSWLCQIQGEGE